MKSKSTERKHILGFPHTPQPAECQFTKGKKEVQLNLIQ